MYFRGKSQSALLTSRAFPSPKSRYCESCFLIASAFSSIFSFERTWRISVLPLGSPIMAVPPPTRAMGLWPFRCMWASDMMGTRLPMWRLVAVGSKPM